MGIVKVFKVKELKFRDPSKLLEQIEKVCSRYFGKSSGVLEIDFGLNGDDFINNRVSLRISEIDRVTEFYENYLDVLKKLENEKIDQRITGSN